MPAQIQQAKFHRAALAGVIAVVCAVGPSFVHATTAGYDATDSQARPDKKIMKQVAAAERAVSKAPQDATERARLGQVYLAAGRFVSAGTTFEEAVSLGDKSPATALGMALSYIAMGRNAEANALLGQWGDTLPASDHALALALAGQPAQAITLLGNAIRQGDNTTQTRQNLAYAYALAGHLPEARTIAAQDIAADKLEVRISEWALQASIGSPQSRVAALLGAPVSRDPGRPAQLAIAAAPSAPALAANEPLPAPPAPDTELSPLAGGAPALAQAEARERYEPAAASQVKPASLRQAADPETSDTVSLVNRYIASMEERHLSPTTARRSAVDAVRERHRARMASTKVATATSPGTHAIQLGSFGTEAGARRAWAIFVSRDPSLKARELRITPATVNGRQYFRVAAAGYQAAEARGKCSSVKGRGGQCLAYTERAAPRVAGTIKTAVPMLARR
jgi:tetratricopeptide (TPR) repeat protein